MRAKDNCHKFKIHKIYVFVFSLISISFYSQTFLRVSNSHLNSSKTYDIFINEILEYKLKGDLMFHKAKLIALSDSTLVFNDNIEVKWSQLKAMRVNLNNHLIAPLSFIFLVGGIGFLPLNTLNNVIIGDEPILSLNAAYVSASLIAASYLVKSLGRKRIRIKNSTYLKVLTLNYQDLNTKGEDK